MTEDTTIHKMDHGIYTIAKMEELFSEIQKLSGTFSGNQNDLVRCRISAARNLASTENVACLERFMELDGINVLHQWLREVNLTDDVVSPHALELVEVLIAIFDRFSGLNGVSVLSGVTDTLKNLLDHGHLEINQETLKLYEKWRVQANDTVNPLPADDERASNTEELSLPPASHAIEAEQKAEDVEAKSNSADEQVTQIALRDLPKGVAGSVTDLAEAVTSCNIVDGSAAYEENSLGCSSGKFDGGMPQENQSMTEEDPANEFTGKASTDVFSADACGAEGDKCDAKEDNLPIAMMDAALFVESMGADKDGGVSSPTTSEPASRNEKTSPLLLQRSAVLTSGITTPLEELEAVSLCEMNENLNNVGDISNLEQKTSGSEDMFSRSSIIREQGVSNLFQLKRTCSDKEMRLKDSKMETLSFGDSSKTVETKGAALAGERPKLFLDEDDADPLEVARLVAIEAERQVIDNRGPFCSSSPDISFGVAREDADPHLEVPLRNQPSERPEARESSGSESSVSVKGDGSGITDDSSSFSGSHGQDEKMSGSVEKVDSKYESEPCGLDLNVHYSAEDLEKTDPSNSVDSSAPIRVSASRGSSVFPIIAPHFEGKMEWKGSAATSAFRRASPRRSSEENTSPAPALREKNIGIIDLNIADSEDDTAVEAPNGVTRAAPELFSGDSSAVLGGKVDGGRNFDLNSSCEEAATTSGSMLWNNASNDFNHDLMPASSFSKQTALRNFDLNDEGSGFDGNNSGGVNEFSFKNLAPGDAEKCMIQIMGSRIMVGGSKDHPNPIQQPFLNGGSAVENRVWRPSEPCTPMPLQGYSIPNYPGGSGTMHYIPPFRGHGSTPYMFDLGAPITQPFFSFGSGGTHQFIPGIASGPPSTFRPPVEVNYGMPSLDLANKDGGDFRPIFLPGQQAAYLDEHGRPVSRASSSGYPLKRKEPDGGWEPAYITSEHLRPWR